MAEILSRTIDRLQFLKKDTLNNNSCDWNENGFYLANRWQFLKPRILVYYQYANCKKMFLIM